MLRLRSVTYSKVGIVTVMFNLLVFHCLTASDTPDAVANRIAFLLGGQLSFVLHGCWTFLDRRKGPVGWIGSWVLFMAGNLALFGINQYAWKVLPAAGVPILLTYGLGLLICGVLSYAWNNHVSHGTGTTSTQAPPA